MFDFLDCLPYLNALQFCILVAILINLDINLNTERKQVILIISENVTSSFVNYKIHFIRNHCHCTCSKTNLPLNNYVQYLLLVKQLDFIQFN